MDASTKPSITLTITPTFDDRDGITGLNATLTLQSPSLRAKEVVFIFSKHIGKDGVESHKYDPGDIRASDLQGELPIRFVDSYEDANVQEWRVGRDTVGDVSVHLHIEASRYESAGLRNSVAPLGAGYGRTELRREQGGIMGVGRWFLPRPASRLKTVYCMRVEWNLSSATEGTRAIWSFGEGPGAITKEGTADILLDSVYMAGPVRSFPETDSDDPSDSCGTYWFGGLPANLEKLTEFSSNMFPRISTFFRDTEGSYRVFIRKVPRGFGGAGFAASSIIEYDDRTSDVADSDLVRLFNHMMVRSWAQLDPEDDGSENEWFLQGFAQMYSIFLPYRFGQRSPAYFRATLNAFLSAYYTSPHIAMPLDEATALAPTDCCALFVPFTRGWVYMLKMDCYTRRASLKAEAGIYRPIDEILGEIVARRRDGEIVRTKDWIAGLKRWLDMVDLDAEEYFQEHLVNGKVMGLEDMKDAFGAKEGQSRIVEVEQLVLCLGFDGNKSFETGVISGIEKGSRAELSGLREGDEILTCDGVEFSMLGPHRTVKLAVRRDKEELELQYLPRGWDMVSVWQVLET